MWGEQHRGSKRKARPYNIAQDSFVVVNPVVQGRWGEDDYGAIRPEDVRFVLLLELIDDANANSKR